MATLSLLLASALGQHGIPAACKYPPQFTAQTITYDYEKNVIAHGTTVYDEGQQRVFEMEGERGQNTSGTKEVLYLYQQDLVYRTNSYTRTCEYGPIPDHKKFTPFGVPATARFHAQINLGFYPTTIPVNEFGDEQPIGPANSSKSITYHTQVTAGTCMPVKTQLFITKNGFGRNLEYSETIDFYDAVAGIEDPNVFVPPGGCKPAPKPNPPNPPNPPSPHPNPAACEAALKTNCGKAGNKDNCIECVDADKTLKAICTLTEIMNFCDPSV